MRLAILNKLIRFLSLAFAILMQFPGFFVLNAPITFLSPFVAITTIAACRKADIEFLLALPILLIAIFKGRWFCWHICPVGTILYYLQKLSPFSKSAYLKLPDINRFLLIAGIITAIVGAPLFAAFDPLVIFNSFFSATFLFLEKKSTIFLVYSAPLIAIILITFFLPNVWCEKICPLGCLQHYAGIFSRRLATKRESNTEIATTKNNSFIITRRIFLYTALSVIPAASSAFLLKRKILPASVRPPGAISEEKFALFCIRCGLCTEVCPERIIIPDTKHHALPKLQFNSKYCNEVCNRCSLVCPTNALKPLTVVQKQSLKIGEAKIDRKKCIAWENGESCMVCHEFCPYQAIDSKRHRGVNCPVVIPEKCRGCGACESQCPAQPHKAIIVHPVVQEFISVTNV